MLFRTSSLFIALVAPTAFTVAQTSAVSECSTGSIQCCESVVTARSPVASSLLGLLGLAVQGDVLVGLGCDPITVIGTGGGACTGAVVCCENNSHDGLLSIGCVPVVL